MSFSLIATGLLVFVDDNAGVLGHPLCLGAIWRYLRHDELAGLALKSVSRLGNSEQKGRLFGFFETGRGIADTVVAFSALAVFTRVWQWLIGF